MMLPMRPPFQRFPAQSPKARNLSFWAGFSHANVTLPAPVPSFTWAGRDKTCYPSPSKRSAIFMCRPPFFRRGNAVSSCSRGIKSTGEDAKCAYPNLYYRSSRRPGLPAASRPILNAPVLARRRAAWPRRRWTAISPPVSCLAVLPGHSATTRVSAAKAARANRTKLLPTEGRRGIAPGRPFCAVNGPERPQERDSH